MVEDFGIPVPGETILIAGAVYAGAGRLNVVAVGVVAFLAAVIGDNIGFAIGHFGGRALALRWGKYVFLTEARLNKAEHFFDRHGAVVITFARFVEGLRQANGNRGIAGMHWLRFLAFNALGAALWVGTWVSLGYLAGNHITTIYHYITLYTYYVLIGLAVLLVGYIAWRLRRRRRRRAPLRAPEPTNRMRPEVPNRPRRPCRTRTHPRRSCRTSTKPQEPRWMSTKPRRRTIEDEAAEIRPDELGGGDRGGRAPHEQHAPDRHAPDRS